MTVIKLSSSGGQVQVVDEQGWVWVTSKQWLLNLLYGRVDSGFVELSLMPEPVSTSRYRRSPVLDPSNGWVKVDRDEAERVGLVPGVGNLKAGEDVQSRKASKERGVSKGREDVVDW